MSDPVSPSGEYARQLIQGSPKQVDSKTFERVQEAIEEDLQVDAVERNVLIDGLAHNKFKRSQIPQVAAYIAESLQEERRATPGGLRGQGPLALKARLEEMGVTLQPVDGALHWNTAELAAAIEVLAHFPPVLRTGLTLALADQGQATGSRSADEPAEGGDIHTFRLAVLQGVSYLAAAHLTLEQRTAIAAAAFRDLRDRKEQSPQTFEADYRHIMGDAPPPVMLTPPQQMAQDSDAFQERTLRLTQNALIDAVDSPPYLERFPRLSQVVRQLLAQ